MQNNNKKNSTTKNLTKKKISSSGKTKVGNQNVTQNTYVQKDELVNQKSPFKKKSFVSFILDWFRKNIIHFWYRWNGIVVFLFVLLVYKWFLFNSLGLVDVGWSLNIMRWYIERLGNEFLYVLLVCLFVLLGMRVKNRAIKSVFVWIALLLLVFFAADIFSLKNFYSRFLIWVFSFFTRENASPYLIEWITTAILFLFGLFFCVYVSAWILAKKIFSQYILIKILRFFVIIFCGIIAISFFFGKTSSYQQNILQIQYRDAHWESWRNDKPYEEYFVPFSWKNERPNIVVVFAESFSSIDSLVMGGNRWLLSWFDLIAKDGTVYTNFVANGCTSDSAHIALLQWVEPWETNQLQQNYLRYKSYTLWLPAYMSQQGYDTTFLSTASLWFLNQKDFLISLQFDTIIGSEAFKKYKKYAFNAAADELLYQKAEEVIHKTNASWKPQFIVLQTISSHKPYNSPYGNTEEKAFAYSDKQLLDFYRYLQKANYFDSGILLVVGDHRKMQSMSYEEVQKRWNAAYGKTVFTVVGKNIPKGTIKTTPLQHLDIFYSLKRLISSWDVLLHQFYNDAFDEYKGRDNAIRYCQYVDKQYVGTHPDNSTRILLPSQNSKESSYVRSYYAFQWDKITGWNGSWSKAASTSSSFATKMVESWNVFLSGQTGEAEYAFPGIVRIAHQWYHKTSPINSIASFIAAEKQWAEAIEMDVSFTKDGYPVVAHGPDIGRIKCVWTSSVGKKNIADFTLQEMQDNCVLYNDQSIVTLQEALAKMKDKFSFCFVDIKIYAPRENAYVKPMLEMVKKMWLEKNVVFSSVEKNVNEQLIQMDPTFAWWEVTDIGHLAETLQSKGKYILMPYNIVTNDIVKQIKKTNKILVVYTLEDKNTMQKLYDWGVRFFMSEDVVALVK